MAAPVQIVWSFDTTGSMSSCLEAVKSQIQDLSQRLLSDIPSLEIGLIAHGDYCDRNTTYLVKMMPFSQNPEEIKNWVSGVGATGGGDAPEAYEIALRTAVRDFAWKKDARRVLALIGDEVPHEASFPDNTDNVDWNDELAHAAEKGIRCFGVQCLHNSHATYFYQALAERTDGLWLPMKDLRIIKDVFLAVCLQVADTKAFDQFRSQLAAGGPVASALVPFMTRLAKKNKLTEEELAALCGIVGKLASEHGKPPKEVFLPIQGVEVSATVGGGACEVELVQTFMNSNELAGRGASFEYRFALPPSAAVFHFEAHLSSGRVVKGVIKAREEARQEYQRAISRGDKAFLMEEKHSDVFSMELGNLEADESVKIVLKYVAEVDEIDRNGLRLRLPQHVAPRSGAPVVNGMLACYPITVNITTSPTSGISGLTCLTHRDRLELKRDATAGNLKGSLRLKPEDGLLNNDLVFDMELMSQACNVSIDSEHCEKSSSNIVQVVVRPPAAEKTQKNMKVVLVVDGSCSMQGSSFQQAREAATSVLSNLSESCPATSCSCLLMQQKITTLCDDTTAMEAKASIEHWHGQCGGGTNFDAALDAVQSMTQKADAILIISDGHGPENPQKLFAKTSSKAEEASTRIFCFGVGPDPGLELLEGLADITGGLCEVESSQPGIQRAARQLAIALLVSPVAVQLEAPDAGVHGQWPVRVLAYPGRRAVAYLCTRETPGDIKINGELVSVPAQHTTKGQNLHRLGAKKRITELERLNVDGANDEAIRKLAVKYGLTSSQTSFLAIDDTASEANHTRIDDPQDAKVESHDLLDLCDGAASECSAAMSFSAHDLLDSCDGAAPPPTMRARSIEAGFACSPGMSAARKRIASPESRGASMASLETYSARMMIASPESRGASLASLERPSAKLCASACLYKSAKNESIASKAKDAVSSFASGAFGRVAALGGKVGASITSLSTRAPPNASSLLGPTSEVPSMAIALRGCDKYFEGVIQHSAFGHEEIALKLMLDKEDAGGQYVGRWTAMGQAEVIIVTFDVATGDVTILDQKAKQTVLQGKLCFHTGSISGEVIQNGLGGGRFYLKPKVAQVELIDTDGDLLVFARLLGGGVAEWCNGDLVVASLKTIRMQKRTGLCNDGEGEFTVPDAERSAAWRGLEAMLTESNIPVTVA